MRNFVNKSVYEKYGFFAVLQLRSTCYNWEIGSYGSVITYLTWEISDRFNCFVGTICTEF